MSERASSETLPPGASRIGAPVATPLGHPRVEDAGKARTGKIMVQAELLRFRRRVDENEEAFPVRSIIADLHAEGAAIGIVPIIRRHFPGFRRKPIHVLQRIRRMGSRGLGSRVLKVVGFGSP